MEIFYTCEECGIDNRSVDVPIRDRSESVDYWIHTVVQDAIDKDHTDHSPFCICEQYTEVCIPLAAEEPSSKGHTIH